MKKQNYDLIILGSGPAGLTAGIYAARYKLNTIIIGKLPGGLTSEAAEIQNFPTYEKISGAELMMKLLNQVKKLGVEIKIEEATEVKKQKNGFLIKTPKSEYQSRKIILAHGTKRRKLGIKKEKELTGKGVNYCATCDAPLYKDKVVGVVGGGNSALTAALLLTSHAKKVYLIHRRDKFRAEPAWVEQVNKNKKIQQILKEDIIELIEDKKTGKLKEIKLLSDKKIKLDGLFVEIGTKPDTKISKQLGLKTEKEYVIVNKNQKTSVSGVFAAGDITNNPFKQTLTAAAEGAIAAKSAYEELLENP